MEYYFKSNRSFIKGDVRIKNNVSIWPFAVLRGDLNYIEVGENSNIQDGCVLHVTDELPVVIGNNVTVGHNAVIHGCKICNNVLIGMGSIILDKAQISSGCIIAAGSVVLQGEIIPENSLVAGVPGKVRRTLGEAEVQNIKNHALRYSKLAERELEKISINS